MKDEIPVVVVHDKSLVPIRWIFVIMGLFVSYFASSQIQRISALEANKDQGRERYEKIIERLSKLEATGDLILKQLSEKK